MRLPESEPDAFRLTFALAVLTGASILLGFLTEPVIGAALFTLVALAAFVWDLSSADLRRRRPLQEAEHEAHPEPARDRRRILVIANETLEGDRLREELSSRAAGEPELVVLAPVLTSKTHWTVSDVDSEMEEARERLRATVEWARRQRFAAKGRISDPNAPLASIEDELRRYGPDEVIVATHPAERQNWLEAGMLERLRDELDIPVTHVVVDRERHEVTVI